MNTMVNEDQNLNLPHSGAGHLLVLEGLDANASGCEVVGSALPQCLVLRALSYTFFRQLVLQNIVPVNRAPHHLQIRCQSSHLIREELLLLEELPGAFVDVQLMVQSLQNIEANRLCCVLHLCLQVPLPGLTACSEATFCQGLRALVAVVYS